MASRALITRFDDNLLDLAAIGIHQAELRVRDYRKIDILPDQAPENSVHVDQGFAQIDRFRLKDLFSAECQKLGRQRVCFLSGLCNLFQVPPLESVGPQSSSRSSVYPRITVSKLLKSWAIPPANTPIASIFCDCRN